jgi:hypothetical protein
MNQQTKHRHQQDHPYISTTSALPHPGRLSASPSQHRFPSSSSSDSFHAPLSAVSSEPFVMAVPCAKPEGTRAGCIPQSTCGPSEPYSASSLPQGAPSLLSATYLPSDCAELDLRVDAAAAAHDNLQPFAHTIPHSQCANHVLAPYNFQQHLVALHAQALVLSTAVSRTQQFIELSSACTTRSTEELRQQLYQLIKNQKSHEQNFLRMLRDQEEQLQLRHSNISLEQLQQQQAKFSLYQRMTSDLIRSSQQVVALATSAKF